MWVVNFDDILRVLVGVNLVIFDFDDVFWFDNSEWYKIFEFGVFFYCVFIVFFNIVRKVVNGNVVVFDIFYYKFFCFCEFGGSKWVGLVNNGDDVDFGGKVFYEFDIKFVEVSVYVSRVLRFKLGVEDKLFMVGWGDEVKYGVDVVVFEMGIMFDMWFFCKNVIVLFF